MVLRERGGGGGNKSVKCCIQLWVSKEGLV